MLPEALMPGDVKINVGLAILAPLLALTVWWLWWWLPKLQVAQLALKIRDAKARADIEDNYRKTVGQALGGVAVLLGTGLAYLQFSQQQRSSHDLLISNQVSKGFEQLGSEKLVIRLGGIYALEGVMNNSDEYHGPVLEALTAFVRNGARANTTPTPQTDIQAALTVIGRRSQRKGDPLSLDLTGAYLANVDLIVAALSEARLTGANLVGANLGAADLTVAKLTGANLARADLDTAFLTGADLTGADLSGADLSGANLTIAFLRNTNLGHANLRGAILTRASLEGANLTGASLVGADLTGAILTGAILTGTILTDTDFNGNLMEARLDGQKQLDEACGSDAVLPKGLTLKPCPPKSPP